MKQPTIPVFQVDAFTNKPFTGNPAAICLLDKPRDETWMQSVAAEMNLSETAFVERHEDGFNLRWFTPIVEVDLCGHATLATAHTLWEQGWLHSGEDAHFHTRSGLLIAQKQHQKIILDFPRVIAEPVDEPDGLLKALGINNGKIFFNRSDYLVHLKDEVEVKNLQPDFSALAKIKARGVMVTAVSKYTKYDFISRFFGSASGINEDPVTGSAYCSLTPFWAERLGKTSMLAFQASNRGGEIGVKLNGDRVFLSGSAVTTLKGELYV